MLPRREDDAAGAPPCGRAPGRGAALATGSAKLTERERRFDSLAPSYERLIRSGASKDCRRPRVSSLERLTQVRPGRGVASLGLEVDADGRDGCGAGALWRCAFSLPYVP